jgi:hypothetical protein
VLKRRPPTPALFVERSLFAVPATL